MDIILYIAAAYLFIINITAYAFMYSDKKKAIARQRRIPEARLFSVAFLGGSIGAILGMYSFRHKTKHLSFMIGFPLILLFQIAAIILICVLIN